MGFSGVYMGIKRALANNIDNGSFMRFIRELSSVTFLHLFGAFSKPWGNKNHPND